MMVLVPPKCPSCRSSAVKKLRPVLVQDDSVLPSRLKTIDRYKCENCGFEGDEGSFLE